MISTKRNYYKKLNIILMNNFFTVDLTAFVGPDCF